MTSYSHIVKRVEAVPVPSNVQNIDDEKDLRAILENISQITNLNKQKQKIFSSSEVAFLDMFSSRLCDIYHDIREYLQDNMIYHDADHAKFTQIILDNISIIHVVVDSEDEGNDLDE